MLELTIGYYLAWFVITYFWSKTKKENEKKRRDRFFISFLIHTVFYVVFYFTGFFEYLLSI